MIALSYKFPSDVPAIAAATTDATEIDVLVIDDEPAVLKTLAAALAHGGYTFRCADNGRSALPLLTQHRFKLIVTDIHMPDMDGLEVIMHCTATLPRVSILAISGGGRRGSDDPNLVLNPARLLGCQRTLKKPFAAPEFLAMVHAALHANHASE